MKKAKFFEKFIKDYAKNHRQAMPMIYWRENPSIKAPNPLIGISYAIADYFEIRRWRKMGF